MFAWFKKIFPKRLKKEMDFTSINRETEKLNNAVKDLSKQVQTMRKERSAMSKMLDEVLNGVGRKHHQ